MDIAPEELEKLRQEITRCFGGETIPAEAQWLLEYKATGRIKQEVWRDLTYLFADSKLRDASRLNLEQKLILLQSLRLHLLEQRKILDRQLWAKQIRPRLNATREIFLDLQDILSYKRTKKEKFRLSSLRKYGPLKEATFRNPLREAFAQAFRQNKYAEAMEILLSLYYRKNTSRKDITLEELERLERELLGAAGALHLDLAKIQKNFAADRPKLQSAAPLTENKVNIVFKPLEKPSQPG